MDWLRKVDYLTHIWNLFVWFFFLVALLFGFNLYLYRICFLTLTILNDSSSLVKQNKNYIYLIHEAVCFQHVYRVEKVVLLRLKLKYPTSENIISELKLMVLSWKFAWLFTQK